MGGDRSRHPRCRGALLVENVRPSATPRAGRVRTGCQALDPERDGDGDDLDGVATRGETPRRTETGGPVDKA